MSLLLFENPSIFIEVVMRAGPEKDRFGVLVDIEIRLGLVRLVSDKFWFRNIAMQGAPRAGSYHAPH